MKEVTQGWRKLHNETYNLHTLPLIIRAARWAEHVKCKTVENFFQMLVAEPEGKRPFGRQQDGSYPLGTALPLYRTGISPLSRERFLYI
jgi:hypothetical protein